MVSMMQCIEDPKLRFPRGIQDLQHMRNAVIRFCDSPNAVPYLASLGNEVVIRIDHKKCSDPHFISHFCHAPSRAMRSAKSRIAHRSTGTAARGFNSAYVGSGPNSVIRRCRLNVRIASESGRPADILDWLVRAKNRTSWRRPIVRSDYGPCNGGRIQLWHPNSKFAHNTRHISDRDLQFKGGRALIDDPYSPITSFRTP
jgi:hypothetical protein